MFMAKLKYDFIKIDKPRFQEAIQAYEAWKHLNSIIVNSYNRKVNIPETTTEALVCYALNLELNKGTAGDAKSTTTNEVIEIKATSNWNEDLTSFSPNEKFDKLIFARLKATPNEDMLYIYDVGLNSDSLKKIQVNKKQSLGDQQKQGKRPRFSVIKKIIEPNNLTQLAKVNLRTKKITK